MTLKETRVGTAAFPRMMACFLRQKKRALVCPDLGALDDRVIAITGATNGIGFETAKSLTKAGASVLMMVRDETKAQAVLDKLGNPATVSVIRVDLSDLSTIAPAIEQTRALLKGRTIDTLIENAGVSPQKYAQTKQGHEIAFGTNVLGHFALRTGLIKTDLLAEPARVVIVTGDIYITTSDCTPDFTYKTMIGASLSYSRSKLGNIWVAKALRRNHPDLLVTMVHPGVVDSGLMMGDAPMERLLKRILLPTPLGAQMSLYCATQSVVNGGYYHNTHGLVHLSENDPALNEARQTALWEACENMAAPFLMSTKPGDALDVA